MKQKTLFLILFTVCICLTSCSGGIKSFDDVVDHFGEDEYYITRKTTSQIAEYEAARAEDAQALGKTMTGEVDFLVHIHHKESTDENPNWAYVVQFSDENGAIELEGIINPNWKHKRFGKVLVYGWTPVIDEISE